VLTGLESMALDIMLAHPEYHALLEHPELAEGFEENPFLHMSLHLALAEQLSIDQPRGISARYGKMLEKTGNRHAALHILMACLEEMLLHARNENSAPDPARYFECLDRKR
ncbi:MAG TPA: DUF1841 family protein, partial [Burkholderiales bacterium]|nr:DUF1841 family protein [Burkholderiales bacterium]